MRLATDPWRRSTRGQATRLVAERPRGLTRRVAPLVALIAFLMLAAPALAQSADVQQLPSQFQLLRLFAYGAIAVSAALGLALYVYRHRHRMPYDFLYGVLLTAVAAPLLFWLATLMLPATSLCLDMALAIDAPANDYENVCRSARESAANLLGLRSGWRTVTDDQIVAGVQVPLAVFAVKAMLYVSTFVGGLVLFMLLKPLCRRMISRRS